MIPVKMKILFVEGNQDLRANDPSIRTWHPSVIETLPNDYPELKSEMTKLESQMFDKPLRRAYEPLTPVIADANDRYSIIEEGQKKSVNYIFSFTL